MELKAQQLVARVARHDLRGDGIRVRPLSGHELPRGLRLVWELQRAGDMGAVLAWLWLRQPVADEPWSLRGFTGGMPGEGARDYTVSFELPWRVDEGIGPDDPAKDRLFRAFAVGLLRWAEEERRPV